MPDETLLEFPVDFPIKMMGHDTREFHEIARKLVEKHTGPLPDHAFKSSQSRKGRFVSITVTVHAQSQQQLDNIYTELTAHEAVLMAL